jgi:RNA polymerase sigma factor (sigma-70 family)
MAEFPEEEESVASISPAEDNTDAGTEPSPISNDDFATMPEPPQRPMVEAAPVPPKKPKLSGNPERFQDDIDRVNDWVERSRQWETQQEAKAQKAEFEKSRKAHNAEARKISAATGAQFNYDADGVAQARVNPQTGEQAFTKRTSPVRYDEQGRPFQVIQNEQGTQSERIADPDANADIGPNPDYPEDKFIYRKTKFQPWQPIDPEEGINSTDGRVVRASAKALFDREKTTLKRERDEISLSLRDPARQNRLSPEARQKVESELSGLSQAAPPPAQVKGMFGGVNIEATEAAKKKWQEAESFRAGLLAEKQSLLAADDERAGLEARQYELDQNLLGLEKKPLSTFLQERRKKKSESLADLDPQTAKAEIEARSAAIAEDDASTESAMQDLQRRSDALNNRTKKGITIQEMDAVASERAGIEADARGIEERISRRNAAAGEMMQGVEAIKAKETAKREESFAELDRQAAKYPELADDAKAFRSVDADYRARMESLQQQPDGDGKQAAIEALNSEFETKRKEAGSAYVSKLEKRISGDVGAAIDKVAGPGGALGFKSQIAALEKDAEIDPDIKKIAVEVIREQAIDALIRSNNLAAVKPAVNRPEGQSFDDAYKAAGYLNPENPEDRAKAAQMLEQDPGLGAKLFDGFDRAMTTFGARMFGTVSSLGKAISHRMGLDPDNAFREASEAGYQVKLDAEKYREKYRDPRLETDDAVNRWIMPAVTEALPNLTGMLLGPFNIPFNFGQLYDEAYSQALSDDSLTEDQRHNAATTYAALALPVETLGDIVSGGIFTTRMIPRGAKKQSVEAAAKFLSKFTNVGEVWDKLPPSIKRSVAIIAAGGTEGLTETVQDKILNATIETIKTGNIGDAVNKALADNRGALDTFIIASMSGGGIKTLETATRTLIERGQNPEEMARRYNGVANSFRLENVLAYAQQAGTKFDPKEYEKLTEASNGFLMRLDRINPNDKVARNDVSRELAQVESRRLTIISEILGKGAVDQAMAGQGQQTPGAARPAPVLPENIAAMQAEIGKAAPERQAPLATAIKILSGASIDSLTKAEQDAIKPHTAKVGGQTVLTDDILTELSQTSPQAATLMQQGSIRDEATRRLEILSAEKEGGENNNENQIQQKGPENAGQGIQGSENAGQNDQGIGTGTLTPGGAAGLPALPPLPVGRGGELISKKEKKVSDTLAARLVQGGAEANAAKKFADYFIKRETLKGWGTEKLNAAVAEFQKAGGLQNPQAILASIEASDATQGAEIDSFTSDVLKKLDSDPKAASLTGKDRENIRLVVRNQIAPSLLRFRPIIRGVVAVFDKSGSSDVQVNNSDELIINAAYMLAERGVGFWANTENADLLIDEEVAHISQFKVLAENRRERTGEDGNDSALAFREAEEIFLQLPEPVREASRKIYGEDNLTPAQSGMEFFRQMLQGDIALSEGRVLDTNGNVIAELAIRDRAWIDQVKSVFEQLFKVFTDLRGNLGKLMRDEGRSDAEIEEFTTRVEKIRKDSLKFFQNLKKEGDRIRGEAYGQEYARLEQSTRNQRGGIPGDAGSVGRGQPPTTPDGRPATTPGGTDGQLSPAGNALGQDQAARLAELESKEQERQAREERAKERRAEYVAAKAGNLKDYDKVVESTPEDAREPVKQLLTQAPSGNTGYVLAVNQRRLPSTWIALPPGVVQTSHIGPNFQKNPEYAGQNTRAYDSDPAEQNKVRAGALPGALNEDILTSTDPSSANSAPQVAIVIDAGPDGQPRARWQAAGGNAREMMSNLAPQEDQDRLSQTWSEKGAQFGFEAMPEGFRGYRFLGTFDIRTEAGAREYQKLVDDLNPSTGVVQDVSDRADLDAKNIPLDLVTDLPVMMSGKQATEALSRLLTAPGNIVERNRVEPMVKNPAQAQAYMQRVMFTAGLGQPTLTNKIADYQLQNRNAAFVELSADAAKSAIALRQSGSPGIADAFGGLLSNVADYLDQDRSLKSALELASSQIEMNALVGDTGVAVAITQRLSELIVLDKRGRINTDATSEAMKDYMVALSSGIARATEDEAMGNLFGQPMTMAERVAAINAAHRRNTQTASETTLSAPKNTGAKRMRELERKRRQEGLTRYESDELARLEQSAGQQFMDFFEDTRDQRFELEQEVERRGIERAPVEQMDLVLSAAPSFNRTKAAARLKEATRQRKKDIQSRIEELKKTGGEYPHRMVGNWRSGWKITSPGRKLRAPNSGAEFVVQSINIPEDKVTLVRASSQDQPGITMGIKEAQKRFEVELSAEELEIEPYFISRLTDMAQMKKDFDRAIETIAAGQKEAYAVIPDLKGAPRALEKIGYRLKRIRESGLPVDLEKLVEDQGGDILRATVLVDSADQIQQTLADILHTFAPDSGNTASTEQQENGTHIFTSGDGAVKILMDDRFSAPLQSGYSDINLKIQLLPGYWAELQVHIPEMLIAKEGWFDKIPEKYKANILGVPNGKGHKLYEEYRALPDDSPRKAYLEKQMAAIYASAIRKYLSRIAISPFQSTSRTKGPKGLGGSPAGTTLYPPTNSGGPSGVVTIGIPSSSQNFAPSGNISRFSVTSFIPSSPTREMAASQPVSKLLQLAQKIATKAHKNQFRKDGKTAYIQHIRDVVSKLENSDENIRAAAWLHDVVEDNPNYSFQEIKRLGVPEDVIAAVRLLTKSQNQSVASYYKNIRQNSIATAVKIADMLSNLADDPSESQRQRYQAGLKYLQSQDVDESVFSAPAVPPRIQELISQREEARKAKAWALADTIRQEITAEGWTIKDTPKGPEASLAEFTLAAPRRKTSDNQLDFDFTAPAVQDYKSALEADGITHPVAQAAAAQQDIGLPATDALDLFDYKPNAPTANPLTAPELASNETQSNEQESSATARPRTAPIPEQQTSARGAQEPSEDGGVGDLFSLMARIRAAERDSSNIDVAPSNEPEQGGGIPRVDGREGAAVDSVEPLGDRRSGIAGDNLPVSGELGGQPGRAIPTTNPRPRGRILQPGNGIRVERPVVGSAERNISLTRDQALAPRGIVGKLRANLEAIRVIQSIDNEKRLATPQEKQQLVKFSGWGALSQVFDDEKAGLVERGEIDRLRRDADRYRGYIASNAYYAGIVKDLEDEAQSLENWKSKWYDAHKEVRALLSDQEYRDARRSTINAHYTSPEIVGGMWDIIKWMGFKGGNILEPGAGIGHFFGLMPEEIADRSKLFGVELDAYTSKILKALYPEADIQNTGFQTADIADNSIDLAISNVPFANIPVRDPALEAMGGPTGNLHDYFFGKTITKLKPGGIQVFITSAFTMDKGNPEIRKWLAERADLIAAYRLPNDAFRENAGTDVVTDIIILRKKDGKPFPHAQSWVNLDNAKTRKGEDIRINEYFATHPQNILGQLDNDGSMYGDEKEMTVHGDPSRPPAISMQQDLARLPQGILGEIEATGPVRTGATSVVKVGNIIERDGKFYRQGQEEPDAELNEPKTAKRTRSFLSVRDALNSQYDLELSETATDEEIEANRRVLNTAYTRFLAENGYFHDTKNKKLFIDDPDYFRLLGAEIEPKANQGTEGISAEEFAKRVNRPQKKTYTRADIFNRRVMAPRSEPTTAETIEDAYGISLGWRGRVDTQFIGQLVGKTPEQVETQLLTQEIAVRDPDTGNIVSREQYLAGNVRKKLSIARAAGADYARNVRLLESVQPQRVGIDDIRFSIGATWIPADIYNRFLQSLGVNSARFVYVPTRERSGWERDKNQESRYGLKTGVAYKQYETTSIDIESIMDSLLNLRAITIRLPEKEGGGIDMGATTAARERAKLLNQSFQDWVRSTPDVTAELEEQFNNEVNAFVQRTYDGQFLQFPWANKDFDIYPDKKNTIWRALQEGFGLIAHGVGGGKTIIGSAVALEMRRLGMARKPMIVVHNATLEGFAQEISKMAPTARVLVGRKDELQGDKRKEFLMRIAAGDWDAVVIAHSTFGMIEDDPQVEINASNAILDEFVATLRDKGYKSINEAKEDRKKSPSVKAMIKQMERLETSIKQASERRKDTGLLNFQQLGVDALIVDEVHKFKKMPFSTQLEAKGIDGSTSKRAYNLLMRARYIQERMGGKNVFSMTGTPVTNTLGEIWNMARLVAPNVLKEWNIELFDQFVSKFAQVTTEAEMGPTGEFKNVDRLAKFVNLPEWNTFLRQAADVKLGDDLVVKNRPGIKGGKPELVAVSRTKGVSSWVAYIRRVLEDFSNLSGETLAENPSLTAVPVQAFMASRAAAIDIRLINPLAKDEPDSKVNRMVERLMGLYRQSADYSGTQVIFADSFNSVRTSLFEGVTSATLDLDIDPTKPAGTTFNLYEDIRQKLIAQGIPTGEIAVITDSAWNSDKKKQALFDLVNEGKIRVIIGSTERLGTGVNMQRLMLAAHHLDVPWTPAELEQRDGRVFRQGNVHGEHGKDIELIRYGMSDTLDAALWQKLETKQRFSNAALSGKVTGRELAEDKGTMTLEEQRAVLSGKYGRRLWEITSRLQELDISRRANEREAETRSQEIRIAKRSLEAVQAINERSQPSITKMRALSESIAANGTAISVSGQTFPTKVETIEAIKNAMETARRSLKLTFEGQQTADPVTSITVNDIPIHLRPVVRVDQQWNDDAQRMEQRGTVSFELLAFPVDAENDISFGAVTSPATLLSRLEELGDTTTGIESSKQNNVAKLRALASMDEAAAWPYQAEYDALTAERVEVEKLYNADLKGKTDAVSDDTTLSAARTQPSSRLRFANAEITTEAANITLGAARTYHGTPHKVDKFSTDKIGTGEGAQAYGYGLYFAQSRDVAKTYVDVGIGNRTLSEQSAARQIFDYKRMSGNLKEGRDLWVMNQGAENRQAALKIWNRVSRNPEAFRTGNLYTVDLNVETEDLIDWDKRLSEQSPKVQAALKAVQSDSPLWKDTIAGKIGNPVGGALYKTLTATWPDAEFSRDGIDPKKKASEALLVAGIPGIRYLDGGSRGSNSSIWQDGSQWAVTYADATAGQSTTKRFATQAEAKAFDDSLERTYNYVVFDENLIRILAENGEQVGNAASAVTLSAARRQVYDPNQLELDFDAAPRNQAAAQEDAEKSASDRFQSGLDGVMAMASTYSNIPGVDMDEVRQTARIALADAARTFDPTRGVPFGPYSSIVVRNRLNALYRRENLRRERIPQSLDEPLPGDFDETRQDYTPDTTTPDAPTMASRNEAKMLIDGLIATLPERMRVAVEGYLQQRQQEEIGGVFGISKQAVSKLQQEGFKRLRQKLNEQGIGSVTEILSAARKNPMTGTLAESIGEYGISGTLPLGADRAMGSIGNRPSAQPSPNTAPVRSLDPGQTRLGIPAEDAFSKIPYAPARVWGLRRLADRFEAPRNSVGGQPIQPPIYRADYDAHQAEFREAAQAAERLYRDTLTVVDNANSSRRGTADYLLPRLPEVRALFTDTNGQVQFIGGRPVELESGEPLFAASGTPQDDGDFIAPGESFESDLKNLLNDLNGVPADLDNAVAKQEQAALEEGGGQRYQVGRPDLAFGANNPDVRGLDQFYTDRFLPETEAQWETAARDMVTKDFEGTRRSIEQAGLSGQTISPELTKAADQIANTLRQKMLQTGKDEDRKAFNVFWYSYRATGTEAGRALASRRDPFKTPAMRHREFLLDLMLTPGKKDKEKIDAEKDPAKKTALIDSVTAALLKKLKDAGISPEDILGNRVVVGLNNAEIQRQFRTGLTPKQSEVFDLLLRKNQTTAQIAQRTGMKPDAVEAVFTAFKNRMRQQHLAKFKAGIHKQSEVTLKAAPTQTGLFGGQVSDAEADAAFDQWFSGMVGTSDTKKIGRPKFRIDDPAHVMRLARAIQSARSEAGLGDMAYEWWIMNILSGPQTQVTNIAGNAGFLALDSTLQRGMEALVNVFVRDKKAAQLGEFKSLARGIMPGITKGLAMAAKAWSTEHDFYEHTVLGTPLELGQWDKLGNTRAAIPGQTGRVVRIPGRALLFADSFFKQLSGQMNVAAFAYRIAKAEGLRGQALTDRVAQLSKTRGEIVSENLSSAAPSQEMVEYFARQLARRDASLDPAELIANRSSEAWELAREQAAYDAAKNAGWTEEAWIRAVEKSKEMTFQQDLKRSNEGGSLFEDAAAKLQDARFNNQLIGFFFPFVKTPYNIFRTGIRKSPIGAANLAWQAGKGFLAMKDGKAFLDGDPTLVRDMSEQLIAWTAMALIFGAVQGDDDDDDKMLLITGSQPRSEATAGLRDLNTRATGGEYVIRIGGRNGITIPYGRFDPIATVLGTTTDLIRSIKRNGSTTENLASLWNYMVAQTNSKTFLQGIANISTILEGKSDPVGATKRTVLQALVPNIIRQPLRNLDDYVRDTKTAPATYTLLPTGNLAEPKVDVYGNEIRKGSSPVMRLFFNSALATEPVLEATDNLLMNWNRANPSMAYAPEQAKAVYKDRNGKEVEMTAEETRRFRLASGRLASVKLRAITTPARVANPTEDDIEAIRKAFSEARRETRERMFAGR